MENKDEIVYLPSQLDDAVSKIRATFENEIDFYNLIKNCGSGKEEGYESSNDEDDFLFHKDACCNGRYIKGEIIFRNKTRQIFKGYDSELGFEVCWVVYNVEDLTSSEQQKIYNKILKVKEIDHPNVLKYFHAELNNENNEIIIITELAGNIKNYLKKITLPKLKVIRTWCINILTGLECLYNSGITQVNLTPQSISTIEESEIKIGDLVVETKFKMSQKYSRKSLLDQPKSGLLNSNQEHLMKNFGKLVLYMLFHQSQVYKIVTRLLQSSHKEILFDGIFPEDLRDFLVKCLLEHQTATIKDIKNHPFLNEHKISKSRGGSKLQFGPELVEYIEVKKAKKTTFDDQSTIYQASVRDEDTKLSLKTRKRKARKKKSSVVHSKSQTKSKNKSLMNDTMTANLTKNK